MYAPRCIEPGKILIADDDSEVSADHVTQFQVKSIPKDPFSRIAKPTQKSFDDEIYLFFLKMSEWL